ncbi:PAT complex subunit CCDC47 like protein [Aduncisulcus paluster]|uniref:PAT complex subunit CCDC47 like protein n=1 Tax=Aduncisulcus paluster TaxID=2918883 RepID=A0ABQ5JR22_9EUKA|nr:PAT complex subunit CCDC47 like protein [Aduncisulcus paluster]
MKVDRILKKFISFLDGNIAKLCKLIGIEALPSLFDIWKNNKLDVICGFILLIALIVSIIGKKINKKYAYNTLTAAATHSLKSHFETVSNAIICESNEVYKIYATGNKNSYGCLVTLNTCPREDPTYMFWRHFHKVSDLITIDIPLFKSQDLTLCAFHPQAKGIIEEKYSDFLKETTTVYKGQTINFRGTESTDPLDNVLIKSEIASTTRILTPAIRKTISTLGDSFMYFYCGNECVYKHVGAKAYIRFVIKIGSKGFASAEEDSAIIKKCIDLVMNIRANYTKFIFSQKESNEIKRVRSLVDKKKAQEKREEKQEERWKEIADYRRKLTQKLYNGTATKEERKQLKKWEKKESEPKVKYIVDK